MEVTVITALLKLGAPWVLSAVILWMFMAERQRGVELADKLYELGMESVKKDTEVRQTLLEVRRDIEEIRRKGHA